MLVAGSLLINMLESFDKSMIDIVQVSKADFTFRCNSINFDVGSEYSGFDSFSFTVDIQFKRCCQTNERAYQYLVDGNFYEITKERHSVRAASRFSLNVLRFESDLCELNRL